MPCADKHLDLARNLVDRLTLIVFSQKEETATESKTENAEEPAKAEEAADEPEEEAEKEGEEEEEEEEEETVDPKEKFEEGWCRPFFFLLDIRVFPRWQ